MCGWGELFRLECWVHGSEVFQCVRAALGEFGDEVVFFVPQLTVGDGQLGGVGGSLRGDA